MYPYFSKHLSFCFAYGTNVWWFFPEAEVATLFAVPHLQSNLRRLFGNHSSRFRWLFSGALSRCCVSSDLFLKRSTLRNWQNGSFSFKHVLSNIKCAVAVSILLYIRVSIVAWADYVPIKLKLPRGKPTWTWWVAVALFVFLEAFKKVFEGLGVRV